MSPVSRLNRWAHPPFGRDQTLNNDQDSVPISVGASSHRRGGSQCGKPLNEGIGVRELMGVGSCGFFQNSKHFFGHGGWMNGVHAAEVDGTFATEAGSAWGLAEDEPVTLIAGQTRAGEYG